MKKIVFALFIFCFTYNVFSSTAIDWIYLAQDSSNNPTTYYGKSGSLKISNNKVSLIGKLEDSFNRITLYKWSIQVSHCNNEVGVIQWYKITDGSLYGENNFTFGSGNVISIIAESMCPSNKDRM